MAKRKSCSNSASPRKRAKLDQSTETPSPPTTFHNNAASSSSSTPSSPQQCKKRKRPDAPLIDDVTESEVEALFEYRRKLLQASPIPQSQDSEDPDSWKWVRWTITESHRQKLLAYRDATRLGPNDDRRGLPHEKNPEAYSRYWEPLDMTKRQRRWQRQSRLLLEEDYSFGCSCGKMHKAIGRKSWHYPGQEPELEDPEEPLVGSDGPYQVPPDSYSVHQNRGRNPLLSPELSDDEADTGNAQLNLASVDASISLELSTAPDLTDSVITDVLSVSPTTSAVVAPTTNIRRASRQRNNTHHGIDKPNQRRRPLRKNKKEKESKEKTVQRQPRNRKSGPTPTAEGPVVSRRSSRSNAGSQLWFLDDSGKACAVATLSR